MKSVFLLFVTVCFGFCSDLFAQKEEFPSREINISIGHMLSTSFTKFNQLNHNLCLGYFHCGSGSLDGVSLSLVNTTNGNMNGLSLGLFNSNLGDSKGAAVGLLGNFNYNDFSGVQFGSLNINGGDFVGLQLSLLNYNLELFQGFQGAFFGNILADTLVGVQLAIFLNYVDQSKDGVQIGYVNINADHSESEEQFSLQIGIVNYSDNPNTFAIGLINLIRGGRFGLEMRVNSIGIPQTAIVSGNNRFYFKFVSQNLGQNRMIADKRTVQGASLGTVFSIDKDVGVAFEYQLTHINDSFRNEFEEYLIMAEYKGIPMLIVSAGLGYTEFLRPDNYDRSVVDSPRSIGFSLGATVNLLGFWK